MWYCGSVSGHVGPAALINFIWFENICRTAENGGSNCVSVKVAYKRRLSVLGGFRVEMQRDARQPRTIACRYDPTEPGMYAIQIMWSGVHVPGSPFLVHICDSRSELERVTSADWHDEVEGHRTPQSARL